MALDEAELEKAHEAYLNMGSRLRGNDVDARDEAVAVAVQYLMPGWAFDDKRPCPVR
jgi:glucarate dehydratase